MTTTTQLLQSNKFLQDWFWVKCWKLYIFCIMLSGARSLVSFISCCLVVLKTLIYVCGLPQQVSAVTDKPAWHAASRQTCCKQRWMLPEINLQPN